MCGQAPNNIPKPTGSITDVNIAKSLTGWKPIGVPKASNVLKRSRVKQDGPKIDEIVEFLNKLDYGGKEITPWKWDCTEKAMWAVVHARCHFVGCAIGMAEGTRIKDNKEEDHAVVIIWDSDLKDFKYYDPNSGLIEYDPKPWKITAFPIDPAGTKDDVNPMTSLGMARMKDKNFSSTEKNYSFYPLESEKPDELGVLEFLKRPKSIAAYPCDDKTGAFHRDIEEADFEFWRDYDQAFWSYMHVRKVFQGCAIGVAFGARKNASENDVYSRWVNILWTMKGEKLETLYWDPSDEVRGPVNFIPQRIFF